MVLENEILFLSKQIQKITQEKKNEQEAKQLFQQKINDLEKQLVILHKQKINKQKESDNQIKQLEKQIEDERKYTLIIVNKLEKWHKNKEQWKNKEENYLEQEEKDNELKDKVKIKEYLKNLTKNLENASETEQEINKLTLLWTLCGLTCHQCGLKCVKNREHQENHNCLTCHFLCDFTEAHSQLIPKCSRKAGHEGKHACDEINHLCGKPCNLIDKRNCQKVCAKDVGHDEEHLCQSTRHYCGEACSLTTKTQKGDYRCPNKCIIPYEEEHESHRCENDTCPIQCPIPDCQRKCQSDNHFHSYSNLQVDHFCGYVLL